MYCDCSICRDCMFYNNYCGLSVLFDIKTRRKSETYPAPVFPSGKCRSDGRRAKNVVLAFGSFYTGLSGVYDGGPGSAFTVRVTEYETDAGARSGTAGLYCT